MTNAIEIDVTERFPFADGASFGKTGPYERIKGRARFAVDPKAPANASVCDIQHAATDAKGLVHFTTDISILKPADMKKGSGRLFFDWGNRGNIRCLQFFNDAPALNDPRSATDAGNGFLMRRGYTIAWLGWQADLLPGNGRFLLDAPVAMQDGAPLTGPVRVEYLAEEAGITTFPLSGWVSTRSHPAVSLDTRRARLTRRRYAEDARVPVPHDHWMFARVEGGAGLDNQGEEFSIVPSDTHIHLPGGFAPGWIYELVYEGKAPLVMGLAHVAVRDFVSFLKHGERDVAGQANPVAPNGAGIEQAYAWGRSQTGRCIRDFVYLGFNADAAGRHVFDGVMPHVAGGGLMWLNHRFANGVVPAGQEHEDHFNPADRFPFSYAESRDHFSGRTDAILKRPAMTLMSCIRRPRRNTGSGVARWCTPIRVARILRCRPTCVPTCGRARSISPTRC